MTHKQATLYGLYFLCPCSKYPDTPHPATVGRIIKTNLVCTKNGLKSGTLNDEQKIWHNLQCSGMKCNIIVMRIMLFLLLQVLSLSQLLKSCQTKLFHTFAAKSISWQFN